MLLKVDQLKKNLPIKSYSKTSRFPSVPVTGLESSVSTVQENQRYSIY